MSTARFFFALVLLALGASVAPACGSDARATDTCRTIETERCKRGPACADKLDNFVGDPDSCIRFYDVQCGRGVPDDVKEPSKSELTACITVIQSNCDAVVDPTKFVECSFLTANAQVTPADTGTAAETAVDTGVAADTGVADAADGG